MTTLLESLNNSCLHNGVSMHYTPEIDTYGYARGYCVINDSLVGVKKRISEILAMRLANHAMNDCYVNVLDYTPDDAILLNRIYLADGLAFLIRVAWEEKLMGDSELWDNLANRADTEAMCETFKVSAEYDFRTLRSGKAHLASLETFFLENDNLIAVDKLIIDVMLESEEYCSPTVPPLENIKDILQKIGQVPGDNLNYMDVNMIVNDVVFTAMPDRGHSNFLWFIKFERTFSETEDEFDEIISEVCDVVDIPKNTKYDANPLGLLVDISKEKALGNVGSN